MGCKHRVNHAFVWGSVEGLFWSFFWRFSRRARLVLYTSQVLALPPVTTWFWSPSKRPVPILAECCTQVAKYTVFLSLFFDQ